MFIISQWLILASIILFTIFTFFWVILAVKLLLLFLAVLVAWKVAKWILGIY